MLEKNQARHLTEPASKKPLQRDGFPSEHLPPIPPAPAVRRRRWAFRKGRKVENMLPFTPLRKQEIDDNIRRLLEKIREAKVKVKMAASLLATPLVTEGALSSEFYCYATEEELLAADVDLALCKRRWEKFSVAMYHCKTFNKTCAEVSLTEEATSTSLHNYFKNGTEMSDWQKEELCARFPDHKFRRYRDRSCEGAP